MILSPEGQDTAEGWRGDLKLHHHRHDDRPARVARVRRVRLELRGAAAARVALGVPRPVPFADHRKPL